MKITYWDSGTQSQLERDCTPEELAEIEVRKAEILATTPAKRAALLTRIDVDTDAIYRAVQGDRAAEYALAEADASAFKAAGYTGTAPSSVTSWATAKGKTNTWAADDILATAAQWRGAQASIRATRLSKKELARTEADIAPVAAAWAGFVVAIKAALGIA